MKQFLLKSTVLTAIVFGVGAILYSTVLKDHYLPVLPFLVLFFFAVTNLVHAYLLKIAVESGARFTSRYMAMSFLKMFFYLAIAILFVVFNREVAKPFLLNFLSLYVIYTFWEVLEISKIVRRKG